MRKQTVDIIGDLVSDLEVVFNIKSITPSGNYFILTTDCTWWLSIKDKITIGLNNYEIIDFDINKEITINPLSGGTPTENSFIINSPNYIHGTLKMAQNEVDAVNNKELLVPFVYLFEVIRDRKNTDSESMIDRTTELRIFFVNSANTNDWLTNDHYLNVIDPMQQMTDLFIKKIKSNKRFAENLDYDSLPLINLSQEGQQDNSVFDCNLSGIELRLFADIREDLSCENKCKC
tara:strand:+ start:387 stop:1085 length:699 start_codon:yes stop_codon:yes gene_type:complete